MSLQMRHLAWFFSTLSSIHRRSRSRFSSLFQVISWLFAWRIWLRFAFSNSSREFFRFFFWSLRSIFIQSSEFSRSDSNSLWKDVFYRICMIDFRNFDSRVFDSRIFLILFLDQCSSHSTFFLAMWRMLYASLFLWLMLVRFADDFEILLEDSWLRLTIFLDSFHDWRSSLYRSQMTNSSFATSSKNCVHSDLSERRTNSIVLFSHKSSFNSTIIDSFVDVWALFADFCICESSLAFEFDSWVRDVSLMLIIFDRSISDLWDKEDWIDQLTSIWKCSDSSESRFSFDTYASFSYDLLAR